jgi:serine/threonine protein kinase
MDFKTGDLLKNGQYRVIKRLGDGGSGVSYLVQDERQKEFVIKILFGAINQKILHDEAYLLQKCRKHPNIVKFDSFFLEESIDRCCLVLTYIKGKTLQEYLEQPEKKRFAIGKAIECIKKIGDAVDFAHQKNLLHRDIKPNNILLRETDDEPILIDFGIARELNYNNGIHTSYHTPGFAPIEQLHPDKVPPREAGNYTDIHALAATLYILLVGKVGIEHLQERSRELERLDRNGLDLAENDILKSPKDFNENISDRLSMVICQGMAPEPSQRPQKMQDWLKKLEEVLVDKEIPNSPLPQPPISQPSRKKSNLIQTINAHSKAIYTVVYHPHNQQIISAGKDGEIKIWDSENFQLIETLAQQRSSIYSLAISSDGKILAIASLFEL